MFVPNRSRHFRVTPRDKGVMSTCRWHAGTLCCGNDGYCDAGPQAMRNCALAASGDSVLRGLFPEVGSRTAELWDALITDLFFIWYMIIYYLEDGSLV